MAYADKCFQYLISSMTLKHILRLVIYVTEHKSICPLCVSGRKDPDRGTSKQSFDLLTVL